MDDVALTVVTEFAAARRADSSRPLLTWYDVSTGERVELSVATFDNWVSKLANLFSLELELEPGDDIVVDLPTCWQASVVLLAAWSAGLVVSLAPDSVPALAVVGPAALTEPPSAGAVLACSLRPMSAAFSTPLPPDWLDFAVEVPGQPDSVVLPVAVPPSALAVRTATGSHTHAELAAQATTTASQLGLEPGGRLLTDVSPASEDGLVACLAAPLVRQASVVLLSTAGSVDRERIATQERVTCTYWPAR